MRKLLIFYLATLIALTLSYRFAWRPTTKVFPYEKIPPPSMIDNGDNNGSALRDIILAAEVEAKDQKCVPAWLHDGKCNSDNNNAECNYDGGDCCGHSCKRNCSEITEDLKRNESTFAIVRRTDRPCPFVCGVLDFNCLQPNQDCFQCNLTNAKCVSQEKCFDKNAQRNTGDDDWVMEALDTCQAQPWSMGNLQTINQYCGQDPDSNIIHDVNDKRLHFPGCGVPDEWCTKRPCCEDALRSELNSTTCTKDRRIYSFFDPETFAYKDKQTSCYNHFLQCFQENYRIIGQCCQCKPGWIGRDCNQAVCFDDMTLKKRSGCAHGDCVSPNNCTCEEGWQGDQCDLGVCASCINGYCIGPDECQCFYGWEGPNCQYGKSYPSCVHGSAVKPDFCQCQDGWQGRACDIPICKPDDGDACGNGYCKDSYTCECMPGWYSRSDENPCTAKVCTELDPMCKTCTEEEPFECTECQAHHFLHPTAKTCHRCDLNYAHCYECNSEQCLKCHWPYFPDPNSNACVSYGIFQVAQSNIMVDESEYYFDVRIVRLYHSHVSSFTDSNTYINQEGVYGTEAVAADTTVEVDYDLTPASGVMYQQEQRIERVFGTVTFEAGDIEKPIYFKIFKRQFFEEDPTLSKFKFNLRFSPKGGQLKHDGRTMTISYYDGHNEETEMNDARYTYSRFVDTSGTENKNTGTDLDLLVGTTYNFKIYSYYMKDAKKIPVTSGGVTTPRDTFFMQQITTNSDGSVQQFWNLTKSEYDDFENRYNIKFHLRNLTTSEMRIYASCRGILTKFYDDPDQENFPKYQRIEQYLPSEFDNSYKQLTFFSVTFEFALNLITSSSDTELRDVKMSLMLNSGAYADVYFNGELVLEMEKSTRIFKAVDCPDLADRWQSDVNRLTGETKTPSGCCMGEEGKHLVNFTLPEQKLDGTWFNYIKIVYHHDTSQFETDYNADACVKLFREVTYKDASDNEVVALEHKEIQSTEIYALTELADSPWGTSMTIDQDKIDIDNVVVEMDSWTDQNTATTYTSREQLTMQAGVNHSYYLEFSDIYGNPIESLTKMENPYAIALTDTLNTVQFDSVHKWNSWYNVVSERFEFYVHTTTSVVNTTSSTNEAQIRISWKGDEIGISPLKWFKIKPGEYDFQVSTYAEDNLKSDYADNQDTVKADRCYVGHTCSIKIVLKDTYGNLLDQDQGIFKNYELNTNIVGPYNNLDDGATIYFFQNLTQYFDNQPEIYHVNYSLEKTKTFKVYFRVKRSTDTTVIKASEYPITIEVYSDMASSLHTNSTPTYKYVGGMTVDFFIKDKYGNVLTDSSPQPLINSTVEFSSYGTNPVTVTMGVKANEDSSFYQVWAPREDYSVLDSANSKYQNKLYPERRGNYNLNSYICEKFEHTCTEIKEYVILSVSPQSIYLTTKFPSPTETQAFGSGIFFATVSNTETFYVQVKDKYGNNYDAYNDVLHNKISKTEYIKVAVEIYLPDGTLEKSVSSSVSDYDAFNGLYAFSYKIDEPYEGEMKISIKILDSEAVYNASVDAGTEDSFPDFVYSDSHYVSLGLSPYSVVSAVSDPELQGTYQDLYKAGLSMTTLSSVDQYKSSSGTDSDPKPYIKSTDQFTLTVRPRNIFGTQQVQSTIDEQTTDIDELVVFDFQHHEDTCIQGSSKSRLNRYCQHFSHTQSECEKMKMCQWVTQRLELPYNSSDSFPAPISLRCQACNETSAADGSETDIISYALREDKTNNNYYIDTQVGRAGTYDVLGTVLTLGSLRVSLYSNPDFTEYASSFRLAASDGKDDGGLWVEFNETTDAEFFAKERMGYSATMQGMLRSENSTFHNFTVRTNMKCKIYFNDEMIAEKQDLQKQSFSVTNFYFEQYKIYDLQIFLWQDSLYQEQKTMADTNRTTENVFDWRQAAEYGYFYLYTETPFFENRLSMPKSMFFLQQIKNIGETYFIIQEDVASVDHCEVAVNYTVGTQFRVNQRLRFDVAVHDKYGNLRNHSSYSSEDTVLAKVYKNAVLHSTNTLIPDPSGLSYYYIYTILESSKYADNYTVEFTVNGALYTKHQETDPTAKFDFSAISSQLDVTTTPVSFYGYNFLPEANALDCIFVNQDLYIILDMKDLQSNTVFIEDKEAWYDQFKFSFDGGSLFSPVHCQNYTGVEGTTWYKNFNYTLYQAYQPSDHQIVCPVRPTVQSYSQQLSGKDANNDRSFATFPRTALEVKPFRHRAINMNDADHWSALYSESVTLADSSVVSEIQLKVKTYDEYGNKIGLGPTTGSMEICSYFNHPRLVLYTSFANKGSDTAYDIVHSEYEVLTEFETLTSSIPQLTFKIRLDTPVTTVNFKANLAFNFILLQGLELQNGFLVQYFSDDNFLGKVTELGQNTPTYVEVRSSLSYGPKLSLGLQDLWSKAFFGFKILSIKTTALIRAPHTKETYTFSISPTPAEAAADSSSPPGLHDANSQINVFVEGVNVIPSGSASGSIFLDGGTDRWYHLEILHSITLNTVVETSDLSAAKLPEFSISWESSSLTKAVVSSSQAIAVDVKSEDVWSSGTLLRVNDYTFI